LFYACYNIRLFLYLLFVPKPRLLIANDLDVLLANYMASRLRKIALVYDSHELFTEVPELVDRPRVRAIWQWIEARILPRLKVAITVSTPIARYYEAKYGVPFRVVRNVPMKRELVPSNSRRGEPPVIIYQGALNLGRGLELMIETMSLLEDMILVIAGGGDVEKDLKREVRVRDLDDRVRFMGRMTPHELWPLTCSASLGISLEEDLGLNYRYALPNKIFDYMQAGIPVLCSDLPEMKAIVEGYQAGMILAERTPRALADTLELLLERSDRGEFREGLKRASEELCWENESLKYLALLNENGITE
jgi:glycosyltransferase involved in cell wall biosynthesis